MSVLYAAAAVLGLLFLIALWQRRIDVAQRARVVAELDNARARGADQALGQYPHIDFFACIGCASCVRACPEDGVLDLVNGIAHVIQPARCIGHARCAEVCPVGAIAVGLGDVSSRADLPRLTDDLESTVPGVFVAGELGGLALIRNAVEQGVRAVDAIAHSLAGSQSAAPDLLIVGAGPAGLAASLRAIELGLRYRTIEQDDLGGTIRKYPRRKLVMTQPVDLPLHGRLRRTEYRKEQLIDLWQGIVREHDVRISPGVRLMGVTRVNGHFEATTSDGPIHARRVLLALGRRGTPRRLGVPGEEQEKVLYQLIDAAGFTGQRLLVVGGGDSAIEAATGLANQRGNDVTLSYRRADFFRLKARNEERIREYGRDGRVRLLLPSQVAHIGADEVLLDVAGKEQRIENDFVFVLAGGVPPYPLLKDVGVGFWKEEPCA